MHIYPHISSTNFDLCLSNASINSSPMSTSPSDRRALRRKPNFLLNPHASPLHYKCPSLPSIPPTTPTPSQVHHNSTELTPFSVFFMGLCREGEEIRREWSSGPIIVGAGPSGLAVAALLAKSGVPSLVLERAQCIASLWQHRTYHRLKLHLPKQFCELPLMGFPSDFPKYPSKQQFVSYMESYAAHFDIRPRFGNPVLLAQFHPTAAGDGVWRVWTPVAEYASRWLVVATGENAEPVVPDIPGLERFHGPVLHTSVYKTGTDFKKQRVLVVGCGNSGMEVSLDLSTHNATPHMVVRNTVCSMTTS